MKFTHPPTEVWYNNEKSTSYIVCDRTKGDDSNCSDKLAVYDPNDHGTYLGVIVECNWKDLE